MRDWTITAKITLLVAVALSVLLSAGGFALLEFERNLAEISADEFQKKLEQSIDAGARAEKASIRDNIAFNAKILSQSGAVYLHASDADGLKSLLRSHIACQEIQAIQAVGRDEISFAAAWKGKGAEIRLGDKLPADIDLDKNMSIQENFVYKKKKTGSFRLYYTDAALIGRIEKTKKHLFDDAKAFYEASRLHFINAVAGSLVAIAALFFILFVPLIILLRAQALKPMRAMSDIACKLADLDLTVSIKTTGKGETGRLLSAINRMTESFRRVIGQVQHSGIQVASSATELLATATLQKNIILNQIQATSNVRLSVEEISDVADELVETMTQVADKSGKTAEFASCGQADLVRMGEAISRMGNASNSISARLKNINEKMENVTGVITTISKVADQTNLLSLNAAIEAEKAGEYGRGFNVVAREVRRLADQTAVAALDIEQMIKGMLSAIAAGVMEMDKFMADVQHSAGIASQINAQMNEIIEQVQALSPRFEEVKTAMADQSGFARNIKRAMEDGHEGIQQTTNSLEESFQAIRQLNEAARSLQEEVLQLKLK
ncbi:MAG: methyl-accepting chemotaxis protein [Gammaproteobacteria bacterium]|nr:methyl-accepting chemotaxis protein [Gammaproteobacteria bacterium]